MTVKIAEAAEDVFGEVQYFAHLPHGAASTIGDDVGGHGCAAWGKTLIHLLDDAFSLLATGEVDIDVWPGVTALAEEALKEQSAADGIDIGDAETVANGAIGGTATALAKDATLFLGPAHEVPDDEEVAGESELGDESEFMIELRPDLCAQGHVIAFGGTGVGEFAQKRGHVVAGRHGMIWEFVTEIGESEFQLCGDALGIDDCLREIGKQCAHFFGALQVALGIAGQMFTRLIQVSMQAQTGEGIQ